MMWQSKFILLTKGHLPSKSHPSTRSPVGPWDPLFHPSLMPSGICQFWFESYMTLKGSWIGGLVSSPWCYWEVVEPLLLFTFWSFSDKEWPIFIFLQLSLFLLACINLYMTFLYMRIMYFDHVQGGGGTFKRWGRKSGHRTIENPWRGYWDCPPPPTSFLAAMRWDTLLHHTLPSMMFCVTMGSNAMEPTCHELKLLLSWLSQIFCHSDWKMTPPYLPLLLYAPRIIITYFFLLCLDWDFCTPGI
jgi:hypothetical protein